MSNTTLNKTKNYFKCVGVVNEISLEESDCKINLKDADRNDYKTVDGTRIMGKVSIRANDGVYTFKMFFQDKSIFPDKNGSYDSKQWKMAQSMLTWNPEINGKGGEPTRVSLEGVFEINDYVGTDGELHSSIQYNVRKASTNIKADEPDGFSWNGRAIITNIKPEVVNEEETGRLVVTLYGANGKGECFPMTAYVESDLADVFEDNYEVGQTVPIEIDVVTRHIGGKTTAKKAFGRASTVNVNNGFDKVEMMIVGADEAIEESDEEDDDGNPIDNGYIDPKVMKMAIKERAKKLEDLKNNPPEKKGSAIKEAKKEAKKMAATKKSPPIDDDEEELF